MKTAVNYKNCEVKAFDLPSLFAGKINAVLTREKTNVDSGKKERIDQGRDWYDVLWHIDNRVKPKYDYLAKKIDYKGPFEGKHEDVNKEWVKIELFKRMEELDYDKLNFDIYGITLKKNKIILNKELLTEKINLFGRSDNWGSGSHGDDGQNGGNYGKILNDKNNDTIILKNNIKPMMCFKCDSFYNESIKEKITSAEFVKNYGNDKNIELNKYKYINADSEFYLLERKIFDNNGKFNTEAWHFNKPYLIFFLLLYHILNVL
jgi:hypothetical protein